MKNENLNINVVGHILMKDMMTGEVLVDQDNAIHPQNLATVIARGLANEANNQIFTMKLGNGGTNIDSGLNINFLPANTVGTTASLYNSTYSEVVDDSDVNVALGNSVTSAASPTPAITSVVTCVLELTADEPAGQAPNDGVTTNPDSTYTFDELGLFTNDAPELMVSMLVFSPVEKTSNRAISITYTLTISVS